MLEWADKNKDKWLLFKLDAVPEIPSGIFYASVFKELVNRQASQSQALCYPHHRPLLKEGSPQRQHL